jgi:uncharacterized protein (UPF0548 family)
MMFFLHRYGSLPKNLIYETENREVAMQKEDVIVLRQVVIFSLVAIVLGFVYG